MLKEAHDRYPKVYPRVGGGTTSPPVSSVRTKGLSPRGRGNQVDHPHPCPRCGSIPAWAGEPRWAPTRSGPCAVYPRVGGGTPFQYSHVTSDSGLSPRGRGNPQYATNLHHCKRSIPAWAGEPTELWLSYEGRAVYPRVGGGTLRLPSYQPRRTGLSPRGRGNPARRYGQYSIGRSIPAWAGEPASRPSSHYSRAVYPRVGGGTPSALSLRAHFLGLSPRGRGNPLLIAGHAPTARSIPAWAGEPPQQALRRVAGAVYPRVGGGTAGLVSGVLGAGGLSPRGRGNQGE